MNYTKMKKTEQIMRMDITGQEAIRHNFIDLTLDSDIVKVAKKLGFWWVEYYEEAIDILSFEVSK